MKRVMTQDVLQRENADYAGTGGRSQGNASLGFAPAFMDYATCTVYPSCFANGNPAPFHLLDGLPDAVVTDRAANGRVIKAKSTLVSGFTRSGFFYTRAAAARLVADYDASLPEDLSDLL